MSIEYSKVAISLPTALLKKADKIRKDVPRSVYIRHALERYIASR
jgi:metal-responsive CopG/Arc/MetJ family transcriptional regulator